MRSNNKLILSLVVSAALAAPGPVRAASEGFEFMGLAGLGIAPGAADHGKIGYPLMFRLRRLPEIPFGFQVSLLLPNGAGANIFIDAYRGERLRLHILDLGVFVPFSRDLRTVRPDIDRAFDLTAGLGLEYNFLLGGTLAVDWSVQLPNPLAIPFYYGGYATRIYLDSLIGSQLWISCGWKF